jgi:hypothetical protein
MLLCVATYSPSNIHRIGKTLAGMLVWNSLAVMRPKAKVIGAVTTSGFCVVCNPSTVYRNRASWQNATEVVASIVRRLAKRAELDFGNRNASGNQKQLSAKSR